MKKVSLLVLALITGISGGVNAEISDKNVLGDVCNHVKEKYCPNLICDIENYKETADQMSECMNNPEEFNKKKQEEKDIECNEDTYLCAYYKQVIIPALKDTEKYLFLEDQIKNKVPYFNTCKVHIDKDFYNAYENRNDKKITYEYAKSLMENSDKKSKFQSIFVELHDCLDKYKGILSNLNTKSVKMTDENSFAKDAFIKQYGDGIVSCFDGGLTSYPGIRGIFAVYVCSKGNKYYEAVGKNFNSDIGNFYEISEAQFYERRTIKDDEE